MKLNILNLYSIQLYINTKMNSLKCFYLKVINYHYLKCFNEKINWLKYKSKKIKKNELISNSLYI